MGGIVGQEENGTEVYVVGIENFASSKAVIPTIAVSTIDELGLEDDPTIPDRCR